MGVLVGTFICMGGYHAAYGAAPDEGLVAHWLFDEGAGNILHDRSGNGNHGTVKGAKWVKNGAVYALQFDGIDDEVDCGAGPSLDLRQNVSITAWVYAHPITVRHEPGIAGKLFGSYIITQYHGDVWSYISGGGNNVRAPLKFGRWCHIVSTYDGKVLRLYMDGKPAVSRPLKSGIDSGGNFFIGRRPEIQGDNCIVHFHGQITDVRLYNRALSAAEVALLARTTNLTNTLEVTALPFPSQSKVVGCLNGRGLGGKAAGLKVAIECLGGVRRTLRQVFTRTQIVLDADATAEFSLSATGLTPGKYEVKAVAMNAAGQPVGLPGTADFEWPTVEKFPNGPPGARRLNNLVTELLNVPGPDRSGKEYTFVNPRRGWAFFSNDASAEVALLPAATNRAQRLALNRQYRAAHEAMRELAAGKYKIGTAVAKNLIVRAVPEMIYSQYGCNPHVREYGKYVGTFIEKHMFRHVNGIMVGGVPKNDPFIAEWKRQGGKWFAHCGVPRSTKDKPLPVKDAFAYIAGRPGFTHPYYDGFLADEFGNSEPICVVYAKAVRRLKASPQFKDRFFYPFAGNLHTGPEGREFVQALVDTGAKIAWKNYFNERRTEFDTCSLLQRRLIQHAVQYREKCPGVMPRLLVTFATGTAPPETQDTLPHVNYRTFLEMQYNVIATHPAFKDIGGFVFYLLGYTDEETVRWVGRMARHYCIEGNTEMISKDPYILTHIRNGDFEQQGEGWTVQPAEKGSIRFDISPGFGWLQGRYPRTPEGDTVIVMRRSKKKPNTFSQEIRNLESGRLYSFEMFSGDFKDLSVRHKHAVTVRLDNVTLIPKKCFTHINANCYSHHLGPYDRKHKAWMNYHWRVFRADGETAKVTVSDWAFEDKPDGPAPAGQELMFNFVQVQPYLEE